MKVMLAQGAGRIVDIASIAGKEGNPTLVPYSSAKAGMHRAHEGAGQGGARRAGSWSTRSRPP